jgi:ribosomal silencing factor RsfS
MLHIFHQDKRGLYDLEDLWSDARQVPLPAAA